jgi:hypothetical protein
MGHAFRPTRRIGGAWSGDGAIDRAERKPLGDLAECHGDGCRADTFHELCHDAIKDAHLEALEVRQSLDRGLAEDQLRTKGPNTQQFRVELLLQPLRDGSLERGHDLAGRLVIRVQSDEIQAQNGWLVARVLGKPEADDVKEACAGHTQLLEFLDAGRVEHLVVHVHREADLGRKVLEERLFAVFLDVAGGKWHTHDPQLERFLSLDSTP